MFTDDALVIMNVKIKSKIKLFVKSHPFDLKNTNARMYLIICY